MDPPVFRWQHQVMDKLIVIRTLLPTDQAIEAAFVRNLSSESRYFRFHGALRELTPQMLHRFTHMDYPLHMALIATYLESTESGEDAHEQQIGVARYVTLSLEEPAEIAVVVADNWQGQGLATLLLTYLRTVALDAGIQQLHASILANNRRMITLARHLGFNLQPADGDYRTRELGKSVREVRRDD